MKQKKGSYFLGLIGAFFGALVAMVPFVIVLHFRYIVFWLAFLFVGLTSFGYDLFGGRRGYGKIPIVAFWSLTMVTLSIFVEDIWFLLNGGLEQFGAGVTDIPLIIFDVIVYDREYRSAVIANLGLSLLIVFVALIGFMITFIRERKNEKKMELHNEQMALHQEMYGGNETVAPYGFQNNGQFGVGGGNYPNMQGQPMAGGYPQPANQQPMNSQPMNPQSMNQQPMNQQPMHPTFGQYTQAPEPAAFYEPEDHYDQGREEDYYREEEVSRPEE